MKKALLIGICVFILGMLTSFFRHKIVAGSEPQMIDEDKVLVNIVNDSEYPVRIYLNQDAANTALVNPDRTFIQQIRSGDRVNIYTPKNNTTFRVSLNEFGKSELLGKEIKTSLGELGEIASLRTTSWLGYREEVGSTQYFDVEEESMSPWGSSETSY